MEQAEGVEPQADGEEQPCTPTGSEAMDQTAGVEPHADGGEPLFPPGVEASADPYQEGDDALPVPPTARLRFLTPQGGIATPTGGSPASPASGDEEPSGLEVPEEEQPVTEPGDDEGGEEDEDSDSSDSSESSSEEEEDEDAGASDSDREVQAASDTRFENGKVDAVESYSQHEVTGTVHKHSSDVNRFACKRLVSSSYVMLAGLPYDTELHGTFWYCTQCFGRGFVPPMPEEEPDSPCA